MSRLNTENIGNAGPVYVGVMFVALFCTVVHGYRRPHVEPAPSKPGSDPGKPLMLSPLIDDGALAEARKLSRVNFTDHLGIESYSGFFTVNPNFNSKHFFWYVKACSGEQTAPVVLWLNGGPGASAIFSLFEESGPLKVLNDSLMLRPIHWALTHHLLYIDSPVGAGFSFTESPEGYCQNQTCMAKDLYNSVKQFFQIFSELQNNDFYVGGESYAGKFVPTIATKIHDMNQKNTGFIINLKGIFVGNGFFDPINQIDYGEYFYGIGLLDMRQRKMIEAVIQEVKDLIRQQEWRLAAKTLDNANEGGINNTLYRKFTGFESNYNILDPKYRVHEDSYVRFILKNETREEIHVGELLFSDGGVVSDNLAGDLVQSVAPSITKLLDNYRVMLYTGQLDIVVGYPLIENFLMNLNFSGNSRYAIATRRIWRVEDEIAGYVKQVDNLTDVMVRNAGHLVIIDQPNWAFDLVTRFTHNQPIGTP